MPNVDPAARYFKRVYPFLRGAHGLNLGTRITRGLTEPGQAGRLNWVLSEMAARPPERVLDAGCGTGLYSCALAAQGHDVTALDFSGPMLRATEAAARDSSVGRRLRLVQADLRSWEPDSSFDIVLCMGVAEYYANADSILQRLYSWAGRLLLVSMSGATVGMRIVLRRAWLRCHGLDTRLYDIATLRSILGRLPQARVRVDEMPWAHCASAMRITGANGYHPDAEAMNGVPENV